MSTPVVTSYRNLHQRISKLLGAESLTPWQCEMIGLALDDLYAGRHPEGEVTMSKAERPDLYEPAGHKPAGAVLDIGELRRKLDGAVL